MISPAGSRSMWTTAQLCCHTDPPQEPFSWVEYTVATAEVSVVRASRTLEEAHVPTGQENTPGKCKHLDPKSREWCPRPGRSVCSGR
ncbi:unnamed protein product [Arctogadus glacialis]